MIAAFASILGLLLYTAGALLVARRRWVKLETARRRALPDGQWHWVECRRRDSIYTSYYNTREEQQARLNRARCDCMAPTAIAMLWPLAFVVVPAVWAFHWGRGFITAEPRVPDPARIGDLEEALKVAARKGNMTCHCQDGS
ncbi:hypothetical protein [Streptomyces sp. NPDC015131]|uniref:hypothetical protein n=1 Tax=Streptomyces sp. NPDC015131 TaxID=3364941 RepID=UPI0036FB032B